MPTLIHTSEIELACEKTTDKQLIETLQHIVGHQYVLTDESATQQYRKGIRFGNGKALAVVRPGSLVEQWNVLTACIKANVIVLSQAANTGLTGGSTPDGDDYDREIVIVSMTRMKKIYLVEEATQVVCLPGSTLNQLEEALRPHGREPHSVIGSSCIGASVFGGVCNNSGGALVHRGPAYTQMSVFARVNEAGKLELINHLGIQLGDEPEQILAALDNGTFKPEDIQRNAGEASDHHYAEHVRQIDEETPARFNADPARLYESSGSAGKVMVFAVRLDTFPIEKGAKVFYIGTNSADELTDIRRDILGKFKYLPISGEYLHRDAFNIAEIYGKDTFLMIEWLGTNRLPGLFALKAKCDAIFGKIPFLPANLADRVMQGLSHLFPSHLPKRMLEFRDQYEHHLLLKVSAAGVDEARAYLQDYFGRAGGSFFECTDEEGAKAFLHRFAAAGAANRYRAVHTQEVEDIMALDIALPRNTHQWRETLPKDMEEKLALKLYYGHFLCYVFHQDYIVKKGNDCMAIEHQMWKLLDQRGAEYPAEHNVGHLYHAKPALKAHYENLDPLNCFNPGIGHTSKLSHYRQPEHCDCGHDHRAD
ncbi:D-lactate dehydrogenase [Pectobacteriaceae bacterium CE90]|nr:D-lactate dehydrogenase [Pectobacteriaceae bacterium CE90]